MSYAVEYENLRETQADGPYRNGVYKSVAEAKRAGDKLVADGTTDRVVIRDKGDVVGIFAGNLVAELIDGEWHDSGLFHVQNWWPKLDDETRSWLLDHAEDKVPAAVLHQVVRAGGTVPGTQWEGQTEYDFRLPHEAAEWIKQQRP
jgi:hypothetical protein